MKSIKSALLAYSAGKFILAAGTFIFLFVTGYNMIEIKGETWFPVFISSFLAISVGTFLACMGLALLDSGWDYFEDVGRDANGQEAKAAQARNEPYTPMTRSERTMHYFLGSAGVIGSAVASIMFAGIFAFAVVDDKSGVADEMDATQERAEETYNRELAIAQQAVAEAKEALNTANATSATATQDAIAAIGGDFAARKRRNDEWVEVAAVYSKQRKQVREAQQGATEAAQQAQRDYASATATLNDVLRNGKNRATAGIEPILKGQEKILTQWVGLIASTKNFFIRIDVFAALLSAAFHIFLRIRKALPDKPTVIEQVFRWMTLAADGLVFALDKGVTAAENSLQGRMGIVAHPNTATVAHSLQAQPSTAVRPTQSMPYPAINPGLSFVTLKEALALLEELKKLKAKAENDGDNNLADKLKSDIDQLIVKIDKFIATQPQQSATVATAQLNATSATNAPQPQPQQIPAQRKPTSQQGATSQQRKSIQSAIRMARTRSRAALAQLEAGNITQERYNEIVLNENNNIARNEARLNAL